MITIMGIRSETENKNNTSCDEELHDILQDEESSRKRVEISTSSEFISAHSRWK